MPPAMSSAISGEHSGPDGHPKPCGRVRSGAGSGFRGAASVRLPVPPLAAEAAPMTGLGYDPRQGRCSRPDPPAPVSMISGPSSSGRGTNPSSAALACHVATKSPDFLLCRSRLNREQVNPPRKSVRPGPKRCPRRDTAGGEQRRRGGEGAAARPGVRRLPRRRPRPAWKSDPPNCALRLRQ